MKTPSRVWDDRTIAVPDATIDLGAFIGRFQFFHNGHRDAIVQAVHTGHITALRESLKKVRYLAILIGSSFQPRTYFNPFTFEEREAYIMASLPEDIRDRVKCFPLADAAYNNNAWILNVQEQVEEARQYFGLPENAHIGLVGHKKDGSSYYLNMFPFWDEVPVEDRTGLSATPLRNKYFLTREPLTTDEMPQPVIDFLDQFTEHGDYNRLLDEYEHVERYQAPYRNLPYRPIFVTVDACVIQSGHVLLVKRKSLPGRGLWAMPGGFLETSERIEDAIYRELKEETSIDVPENILRGRTKRIEVFDAVHRSSRGRTITHCALINLQTPPRKSGERVRLPRTKGQESEVERVKWWPLKGPGAITQEMMFEDHMDIILKLTGDL